MKRAFTLSVPIVFILISNVFAHPPEITDGLNYLSTVQNPDGSWGSDDSMTDILPSTVAVVEALNRLDETGTVGYVEGRAWLEGQSLETTDYLAERMQILSSGGTDLDVLLSYVDEMTYAWGGHDGYEVNILDTALALLALKRVGYCGLGIMAAASNFLSDNQNSDGGWGFTSSIQ